MIRAMDRVFWEIFLVVLLAERSVCVEKIWLPDLEWGTAKNWVDNRIPEVDSHVAFPLEMRHAVGVPKSADLRFTGIDLARSGSLVLPRNGRLELSVSKPETKVRHWSREGRFFWADPENWSGSSKAAPHLEQVPCRQDDIVLPESGRTFSIQLPMKDIQVRSVREADRNYSFTLSEWMELEERREFGKGLLTVNYAEYSCQKCACQDDGNGYYLEEICAIQWPRCGFTPCEFPLRVEGHCCGYCGGRLSLPSKASLGMVRIAVSEALEKYAQRIAWHIRHTWNGAIEVLIKGKADYSSIEILEAVELVKANLQNTGIEVLSTQTAGSSLEDHRLVATLVTLFVTPFVVLAFFLLGFLYAGYSFRHVLLSCGEIFASIRDGIRVDKPQSNKPFSFARFENIAEGNVQIANTAESAERADNLEERNEPPPGGRFENPLYRSKRKREEEKLLEEPLSMSTLRDRTEDNMEEAEVDIDE